MLAEGVVAGLVGVVGNTACGPAVRAAAADAIGAIAVPGSVTLDILGEGEAAAGVGQSPTRTRKGESATGSRSSCSRAGAAPATAAGQQQSQQQQGLAPGARVVDPKLVAVRCGAVAALVGLVREVGPPWVAPHHGHGGELCVLEAAEALYVLAGCQAGRDAAVAAGARDVLQEIVLAGKRRQVGEKAATAAYNALMRFL